MRHLLNWDQSTGGDGVLTVSSEGRYLNGTATGGSDFAFIYREIPAIPRTEIEVVFLGRAVSGDPVVNIDYPASGTIVKTVSIDSTELEEYHARWFIPFDADPFNEVCRISIGLAAANTGEFDIYDPAIFFNGSDIDVSSIGAGVGNSNNLKQAQDCDDYIWGPSWWYTDSGSTNTPSAATPNGILEVIRGKDGTGSVRQTYYPDFGEVGHYERRQQSGGTWSSWVRMTSTDTIETSSVASAPDFVGQLAVVAGVGYIATGTASSSDWSQIT